MSSLSGIQASLVGCLCLYCSWIDSKDLAQCLTYSKGSGYYDWMNEWMNDNDAQKPLNLSESAFSKEE